MDELELTKKIAMNLLQTDALENLKSKGDPVEYELAYDICEIVESIEKLSNVIIPIIIGKFEKHSYEEALDEFRFELKHIFYHYRDSNYLSAVDYSGS